MTSLFPSDLYDAAHGVLAAYGKRGLRIVTAESCTGGLIAGLLTEVPGSSSAIERGYVTYSNVAKSDVLGVPEDLLERVGAVSAEVAHAMAEGALRHSRAHVAVSVTGIAGPDGGSDEKPVGLVYFGLAARDRDTRTIARRFGNPGRQAVRLASVRTAIALLSEAINDDDGVGN